MRKLLTPTLFLLAACNRTNPTPVDTSPAPADAPPALAVAHEAYLAGDFVEMGERLREVIVDPHTGELARDNAFALLESAYAATHGRLLARAALPSNVKSLSLGVINGANPFGAHHLVYLDLRVPVGRSSHVKDMRVTRLPNEPILALSEKRGTLRIKRDAPGFERVDLEVRGADLVLPERGAFAIQIVFDDAPPIDAFVLASKLVASAQPEILAPEVNDVLRDPHPELAWRPYRSPALAPWESRSMWLGLSRDDAQAWELYKWDPGELGSARVDATLEPGSYWLDLLYIEERTFGGIRLARAAEAARPFNVVR